jgi:hypothetical protein
MGRDKVFFRFLLNTRRQIHNCFFFVTYKWPNYDRVFFPAKPF